MAHTRWFGLPLALLVMGGWAAGAQSANVGTASCAVSQGPSANSVQAVNPASAATASRLAGDWQSGPLRTLSGSRPPSPQNATDLGLAPAGTRLERMLLLLQPSAAQSSALDAELQNQQTPGNCEYHHWLTAQQFAAAYANSAADANAVAAWLGSQGFQVAPLPASREWIEFSGTAAQVEQAFHAPVHAYATAGERRFVLAGAISVPAALVPVIHGLVSLDGAVSAPAITTTQSISASPAAMAAETSLNRAEALTPQLAAQALDLPSAQTSRAQGDGESIAIAARSNIQAQDLAAFRSNFGLPANSVVIASAGADPGLTADQAATELAASWAGAAAPGARIVVAPAASTAATDGIDLSLSAIVDRALAHTVVIGYSSCEAALSDAHRAWYAALYRLATAEGISAIVAAGDSGAAACHAPGSSAAVTSGLAVNALASTPWNTAVGAAAFSPAGDSTLAAWSPLSAADPAYAGGGGFSSTYKIPAWQRAYSPTQTGRALPDVALPAALDSAMSRGLAFCFSGSASTSGCNLVRSGGSGAAAAIFGGISALLAQQNGAQGNLAPRLYALSSGSGVFHDVQQGSTRMACAVGSSDCDASGSIGYMAGSGYDLATGLGSPDVQNLLSAWAQPDVGTTVSTVGLAVSPVQANATYNPQATITFTATVTPGGGGATPTGTIDFFDQALGANLNSAPYGLDSNGAASITLTGAIPQGGNSIIARYSGDATYAAQNSQAQTVNIQPSSTTSTVSPATNSPVPGTPFSVTVNIAVGTPPAGTVSPTGQVTLTLDGANYAHASVSTTGGTTSATFSVTVATSGPHNLQAIYAGDANYATSTSQPVTVNASSNSASVTLAVAPTQPGATYNPSATLTFTATVASQSGGATPTGTVNFFDQATGANLNAAPVSLVNGIASVTVPGGLPQNGNSIFARYLGDTTYGAQSSQALTVNIQPSTTTTTVTPATNSPTTGTAFNVTATVAVGTPPAGTASPTGQIRLTLDGANYGTASASSTGGVTSATFSVTVSSGGSHNLQAVYAGDANYATSTSQPVTVNAGTNNASVALTVAPTQPSATYNPSATLTFTATVSSQSGGATPTGTVNFFDQATGTNLNAAPVALTNGIATLTIMGGLPQNGNSIFARYLGDTSYAAQSSQALTVNIQPSTTTTTVKPSTATPTAGTAFPVTVTIAIGTPPAGTAAPTGMVNLTLDGVPYASATVTTTAGVTSASFNVTVTGGGGHNLQAVYAGDANYAPSTSATVTVSVSKGATVTTLKANPTELTPGAQETFTATIAASNPAAGATNTFTGSVTFFDGATQLGSATVNGNTATLSNVTLSTAATHVITAVYSGDDTWGGSTSNAITLKVVLSPVTVTLTVTPATAAPGQVVTLTATVTPAVAPASAAEQNPTGNIVFYNGTKILATVPLSASLNNTSTAQLLFTTLPAGQDVLSAAYIGDLFYAAGTSNAVTVTVQDFTITPAASNPPEDLDINKGTSGQASFVITGLGGFNSVISVTCSVPALDDMTCVANPQQLTPTATVTFTVNTFMTGGPSNTAHNQKPLWPPAAGGTALAALLFFLLPWGRRVRIFSHRGRRVLLLLLLLGSLAAAGMGCSSISGTVANASGTPLGQTTLTITAATSIDNTVVSHSTYLSVNVLPPGSTGTSVPVISTK